MNKLEEIKTIGQVFIGGAKLVLEQDWTYGTAAIIGLTQGLKYTGSIKRGVIGGAATLGTIALANGIYNVARYLGKSKGF